MLLTALKRITLMWPMQLLGVKKQMCIYAYLHVCVCVHVCVCRQHPKALDTKAHDLPDQVCTLEENMFNTWLLTSILLCMQFRSSCHRSLVDGGSHKNSILPSHQMQSLVQMSFELGLCWSRVGKFIPHEHSLFIPPATALHHSNRHEIIIRKQVEPSGTYLV